MLKIVALVILCGFIIILLKSVNPEFAFLALISSGCIILFYTFNLLESTFATFNEIIENSGLDYSFIKIILKITAIGYIVEFGAGTLEDFGLITLSKKLVLLGRVVILGASMPIIIAVYNLLTSLL